MSDSSIDITTAHGPNTYSVNSNGLATLDDRAVALRNVLDATFEGWGVERGADRRLYPPLIDVASLARLDYFANFPHLAVLTSGLADAERYQRYAAGAGVHTIKSDDLSDVVHVLPSAACYNVYLSLTGAIVGDAERITTISTCYRRESEYHTRRLLGFTMREIVCVGSRDSVLDHISSFKRQVLDFAGELGLPISVEPAADPFFEQGGSKAVMQKLFPVKEEFVLAQPNPVALGSVNFHRNYFGEKCAIRTADGNYAFSSCAAFGLERWISVLTDMYGDDAAEMVIAARQKVSK